MEVKKITDSYVDDNVEITANQASDVRLMLSALRVYRNQLDTQMAINNGLRNGAASPLDDRSVQQERTRVDAMAEALSNPQPYVETIESPLASS